MRPPDIWFLQVKLCSGKWADPAAFYRVAKPVDSKWHTIGQLEALQQIVLMLTQGAGTDDPAYTEAKLCSPHGADMASIYSLPPGDNSTRSGLVVHWHAECLKSQKGMTVKSLAFRVYTAVQPRDYKDVLQVAPVWSTRITHALLQLDQLQDINMNFGWGTIPAQLGGLKNLVSIDISHYCLHGELPLNYFLGWDNISVFRVYRRDTRVWHSTAGCGLTGSLPGSYFETIKNKKLPVRVFDVHSNLLSGQLPANPLQAITKGRLDLSGNLLTGALPGVWDINLGGVPTGDGGIVISLAGNELSGDFPAFGQLCQSYMSFRLDVSSNFQLQGCLPRECDTAIATVVYNYTAMSGVC